MSNLFTTKILNEPKSKLSEAKQVLNGLKPKAPLKWSDGLALIANMQCLRAEAGPGDHVSVKERSRLYGSTKGSIKDNVYYDSKDGARTALRLFVDSPFKSKVHRYNIINKQFTEVGVATCTHSVSHQVILVAVYGTKYKINKRGEDRMNFYSYRRKDN